MKIVVTGSESFVGKELISQCKKNGIEVIGLDLIKSNEIDYEFYQVDINTPKIFDVIPENVDALAASLEKIYNDPLFVKQVQQSSNKIIHEKFDRNKIALEFLKLIEE